MNLTTYTPAAGRTPAPRMETSNTHTEDTMSRTESIPDILRRYRTELPCQCRDLAKRRFWADGSTQSFAETGRWSKVCTRCGLRVFQTNTPNP